MGLVLFIVALIILGVLCIFSWLVTVLYYLIRFKFVGGLIKLNKHFYILAILVDIFGNVACGRMLHLMFVKRNSKNIYNFGAMLETVSLCLAINLNRGNLNWFGLFTCKVLEVLDKGHLETAIAIRKQNDEKAMNRFINNEYK